MLLILQFSTFFREGNFQIPTSQLIRFKEKNHALEIRWFYQLRSLRPAATQNGAEMNLESLPSKNLVLTRKLTCPRNKWMFPKIVFFAPQFIPF